MLRQTALLGVPLLAVVALTGCSPTEPEPTSAPSAPTDQTAGETTGEEGADTSLAAALAATPASDAAKTLFYFSDLSSPAAASLLDWMGELSTTPTFRSSALLGMDVFAVVADDLAGMLPAPGTPGATAITISNGADQASRFTGAADPASVFEGAAGERSDLGDGTLLVRRADGELDLAGDEFPAQLGARLNVAWLGADTSISGTTRTTVEQWASMDGTSLAEHYTGIAACLGDVLSAAVLSATSASTGSDVGVGVGPFSDGDAAAQTLCIRTDDPDATIASVKKAAAEGTLPDGTAISDLLGTPTVEDAGSGWVRLRTADGKPDALMQMMLRDDLRAFAG
ncbi:hypothetical protein FM104_10680 [Microbacterium esteraromaticum]|uniref:Lipoprotein n=1 Tax=Microbacterium esteraromaticum TaxID=57043 RepID=A0A1R4K6H9_9MICO|nr:hypothetical protein [Microbacterium esteraromaticum]SJN39814.1 hypothetical protein FM104_10680 [Microbacterium esteraromaticum]